MDLRFDMNVNGVGYTTSAMSDVFVRTFSISLLALFYSPYHYHILLGYILQDSRDIKSTLKYEEKTESSLSVATSLRRDTKLKANSSQQITRLEIVQGLFKSFVKWAIGYSTSIQLGN